MHALTLLLSRAEGERISERLSELGCEALELRPEGGGMRLLIYAQTETELDALVPWLRQNAPGKAIGRTSTSADWELEWTKYLEPFAVNDTLTVYPRPRLDAHGSERPPTSNEIVLQPALAFGFGEHPTTRQMARWLSARVKPEARVLDFGCGTGVLSLVAARFGASAVLGIDLDERATSAARTNARINDLEAQCRFTCERLEQVAGPFDVVVANIDARVLEQAAQPIATRLSQGGVVAVCGFLDATVELVDRAFARAGIELRLITAENGWPLLANR